MLHKLGWLRSFLVPLIITSLAAACAREEEPRLSASRATPIVPVDTGTVLITTASADTFSLSVEIAETPDQTEIGLMERDALPQDEGMIFLFQEQRDSTDSFWMFRTRIPLDIAYLDESGRIVAIHSMEPCESPYQQMCVKRYPPGVPYRAGLEVNRGYFTLRGINVGDRISLRRPGGGWPAASAGGLGGAMGRHGG